MSGSFLVLLVAPTLADASAQPPEPEPAPAAEAAPVPPPALVVLQKMGRSPVLGWPEGESRARSELESAGILVVEEAAAEPARRVEIEAATRAHGAVAGIRIERRGAGAVLELHLARYGPGAVTEYAIADDVSAPDAAGIAGLRTVEILAAGLSARREEPPRVLASAPPPSGPPQPELWLRVGPLVAAPLAVARPAAGIEIGLGGVLRARFAADVAVGATLLPAVAVGAAGNAGIRIGYARARALLRLFPTRRLSAAAGAGAGVLYVRESFGDAAVGAPVAEVSARAELAVGLGHRLGLRAGLDAGLALPPVMLELGGERLGRVGRPLLGLTIAVEGRFR